MTDGAAPQEQARRPLRARFELRRKLGSGGMGVVWEAYDRDRMITVALKGLREISPARALKLKEEFRALRDIQHPNLVSLGELIEAEGRWYFTMEIIDGVSFKAYARGTQGPIDEDDDDGETPSLDRETDALSTSATQTVIATDGQTLRSEDDSLRAHHHLRIPDSPRPPKFDAERTRAAMHGLLCGLHAIHRRGIVHCDVKPSNVLVDGQTGRVVLLDFGVVSKATDESGMPTGKYAIRGTWAYMAPEQIAGQGISAASDMYAAGVCLFQALTGHLPFPPDPSRAAQKCVADAASPSLYTEAIPEDLRTLCEVLLDRDPKARPSAFEAAKMIGLPITDRSASSHELSAPPMVTSIPFVGRSVELARLMEHLACASARDGTCVFVTGESGIGKSSLIEEFARRARAERPNLCVLRGRCHGREQIPFGAWDSVVDDITRWLCAASEEVVARVWPRDDSMLVRIFPMLQGVPGASHTNTTSALGDARQRRQAFDAFKSLLRAMSHEIEVLICLNDLQWADRDSLALLSTLFDGNENPQVTAVATIRTAETTAPDVARQIQVLTDHIPLRALNSGDADKLISGLLTEFQQDMNEAQRKRLIQASAGHPMFLAELVRYADLSTGQTAEYQLDDVLLRRATHLPVEAQSIMQAVSVASGPVPNEVVMRVAGVTPDTYATQLNNLTSQRLLQAQGLGRTNLVESFHARVQEALYTKLDADKRRDLHREIAEQWEALGGGAESIADHFFEGGDPKTAATHAERAARHAVSTFAFDSAARWLRKTLEWSSPEGDERKRLLVSLGKALSNAGRRHEAGTVLMEAANLETDSRLRFDALRHAAEDFLSGGYFHEGVAASDELLQAVGLSLPRGRFDLLGKLFLSQTRRHLRGLKWTPTPREEISEDTLRTIDACWAMMAGLGQIDALRVLPVGDHGHVLSLDTGEPARVCRSLMGAIAAESAFGREKQVREMLESCERAAVAARSPIADTYLEIARAMEAFLLRLNVVDCLAHCERASALMEETGRTRGWESDYAVQYRLWSLFYLAEIGQVRRDYGRTLAFARQVGHRYMEVGLRTFFPTLHLADDRPIVARQDIQSAMTEWVPGTGLVTHQHLWAAKGLSMTAIYAGEARQRFDELEETWSKVQRSALSRVKIFHFEYLDWMWHLSAAALREAQIANDAGDIARFQKLARRSIKRFRRYRYEAGQQVNGRLADATMAYLEGDLERATKMYVIAHEESERIGQGLLRHGLMATLARLDPERFAAHGQTIHAWGQTQGVRNPQRFLSVFAPGPLTGA